MAGHQRFTALTAVNMVVTYTVLNPVTAPEKFCFIRWMPGKSARHGRFPILRIEAGSGCNPAVTSSFRKTGRTVGLPTAQPPLAFYAYDGTVCGLRTRPGRL